MKIRSPVIAAGGGSLAGLTLSRNRGGIYLRARATPVNPATGPQTLVRTAFGNLSTQWQSLTDVQREAWTTYAINVPVTNSLGESITLTGHQMFVRNNTARVATGLSAVLDGPVVFASDVLSPVNGVVLAASNNIGVVFEETDAWVGEDDAALMIYASRQKAPTINYFKGPYNFVGAILGDSVTPPTSPDTNFDNQHAQDVGNAVFLRFFSIRADGRISPVQFDGPNVVS